MEGTDQSTSGKDIGFSADVLTDDAGGLETLAEAQVVSSQRQCVPADAFHSEAKTARFNIRNGVRKGRARSSVRRGDGRMAYVGT